MAIITLEKASLAFGHHKLLDNISFGLEKNEKIGIIGRNGAGKSSLLKILAGYNKLDDGNIHIQNGLKIIYVGQEPILNPKNNIFEEVLSGLGQLTDSLRAYYQTLDDLEHNYSDTTMEKLSVLQSELDYHNGWSFKNDIDKVLFDLNLNGHSVIEELSGGLRKKVAIAKALVAKPDVLLLDEPTNHLDIAAIEWLEQIIVNFQGSILLITHDRKFLDNCVEKILELDRGKLNTYKGNYSIYLKFKQQQLHEEGKFNQEFDKFLAQEEVWIRKGVEARRTRNEGRVKRLEELRKLRTQRREQVGQIKLNVDTGNQSGKIVADIENISVLFDDKIIFSDFTSKILRGDKIGLIGPNGIGKTTLLKTILGEIIPNIGNIKLGTKLEIAYFDQFREQLNDEATIQDVISQGQDYVIINGYRKHIATYLEEFLFEPARFRSPVKSLSGGERNRLLLARLFSKSANVLILDEPTNDLDMDTLEILEEMLANYAGTVFLVSHDREFLDNVVTQSYVFLGGGEILEYSGGYSDWISYKPSYMANKTKDSQIKQLSKKPLTNFNSQDKKNKLSYKEKNALEQLPLEIEQLEIEQNELNNKLTNSKIYSQLLEVSKIQIRIKQIDELLVEKLAYWEQLEARTI